MDRIRLSPIGFWSYARLDDELSSGMGQLSRLRSLIRSELQQQLGRAPIQIFQDTSAIPHGARWEDETRHALNNSTFFIPILTPNFLQSPECCKEVRIFLERQEHLFEAHPDLPRTGRIFPIHYIDVEGADVEDEKVRDALAQYQWCDFRDLRPLDLDDPRVRSKIIGFTKDIRDLLRLWVEAPASASPPPIPPARVRPPASQPPSPQPLGIEGKVRGLAVAGLAILILLVVIMINQRNSDHGPRSLTTNSAGENAMVGNDLAVSDSMGNAMADDTLGENSMTGNSMAVPAPVRRFIVFDVGGRWSSNSTRNCGDAYLRFHLDGSINNRTSEYHGRWFTRDHGDGSVEIFYTYFGATYQIEFITRDELRQTDTEDRGFPRTNRLYRCTSFTPEPQESSTAK